MTAMHDLLEHRGWIHRTSNPGDRTEWHRSSRFGIWRHDLACAGMSSASAGEITLPTADQTG
jgi:hypothetical protein